MQSRVCHDWHEQGLSRYGEVRMEDGGKESGNMAMNEFQREAGVGFLPRVRHWITLMPDSAHNILIFMSMLSVDLCHFILCGHQFGCALGTRSHGWACSQLHF